MKLGSRFSISAYGAGFSVLYFSLWTLVLGSPSRVMMKLGSPVLHFSLWSWVLSSPSRVMKLGSQFSISAYGAWFSVLHLTWFSILHFRLWSRGFSVLHFSLWNRVLSSPSRVMKLGAQFSSSAYGSGFLVLHLK